MMSDEVLSLLQRAVGCHAAGDFEGADGFYRQVLARDPDNADALSLRGALMLAHGALEEARSLSAAAVARAPEQALFHSRLGSAELALGRKAEAQASFAQAVALDPGRAEAHNNLGLLHREAGNPAAAEAAFRAAIAAQPDTSEARCNLGALLQEQGRIADAAKFLEEALRLRPDYPEAHLNLGNTLRLLDRHGDAARHLQRALELRPDLAEAHNSLGLLLRERGEFDAAGKRFRQALALRQGYLEAQANLDLLNYELGLSSSAALPERFDRASLAIGSNRMVALLHDARLTSEEIAQLHREWGARIEAGIAPLPPLLPGPRRTRLRIGLLSGDMRLNPAFYFVEPMLRHMDSDRFELFVYANVPRHDRYSRIQADLVDVWRDITVLDDAAAAALVQGDGLDLLMVTTGHFEYGRIGVAARAPAPRLLNYPSYPASLGLSRVGWRLTDVWCDPPGTSDHLYVERSYRVEGGHLCYAPPEEAPKVSPAPCLTGGPVTFGSFNRLSKLNDRVLDLWARILTEAPESRLFLKTAQFVNADARQRVSEAFAARGIAAGRLDLERYSEDIGRHLADYGRVDIALDPFPYSGQTTTCEALWMGVPVIALAGDSYVSRVSGALLQRIGHPELVAENAAAYCGIAVALAREPVRLDSLRGRLRQAMLDCTLSDPSAFAPRFQAALEHIVAAEPR